MPPIRFEWGYRLTSVIYKEALKTKVLPLVKKFTKKSENAFQQDGAQANSVKIVHYWLDANMSFCPKDFGHHSHQVWNLSTLAVGRALRKRVVRYATAPDFYKPRMEVDEEMLHQKGMQELPTLIRACYCSQR